LNRRNIVILAVITVIFGLIAFTLLQKNTGIKKIIFTENPAISASEIKDAEAQDGFEFTQDSQIYIAILVENIKAGSKISTQWFIDGNAAGSGVNANDAPFLLQENNIELKQEGSGVVTVSLARRDNENRPGNYSVNVSLNDSQPARYGFTVSE